MRFRGRRGDICRGGDFRRGGGGFRGRGFGGGRGRGGFGGGAGFYQDLPEKVMRLGYFDYPCQGDLICKVEMEYVPYFNAPIYLENKECIGKIDEIFGNPKNYYVSIKLNENKEATSFKRNTVLFINSYKVFPLRKFIPPPPGVEIGVKGGGGDGKDHDGGRSRRGFRSGGKGGFREGGGEGSFRVRGGGGRARGRGFCLRGETFRGN